MAESDRSRLSFSGDSDKPRRPYRCLSATRPSGFKLWRSVPKKWTGGEVAAEAGLAIVYGCSRALKAPAVAFVGFWLSTVTKWETGIGPPTLQSLK